jgi:TonB-linked SusC/RagA family outer membrane protein
MMMRKLFKICVLCSALNMFAQARPEGNNAPKTTAKEEVAPASKTKESKIKVTGKIKNEAGDDIVGANVSVQGKDISVVSDATGQFTILVVGTDVLVISSLGMEDVILPVEGKKRIYINMVPRKGEKYGIFTALGIEQDEEKTNVGYEQVSGDNVELGRDALDGVEGITPGLDVVYASSMPGASAKATIRGGSSPFNNEPLIVVDGVPINTLSFGSQEGVDQSYRIFDINPQDVQMVTVLKGAAATALYGSRGGNGAILYTTRRGKNGKLDITYNTYFRADFARAMPEKQTKYSFNEKDANTYSWGETLANAPAPFGKEAYDQYGTFFKPGLSHSHNLSIAGGKGRFKTFSSLNYTRGETAMLPGLTYQKLNLRFNGSSELSDKVSVDFSTTINNYQGDKAYKGGNVLNPEGNGTATLFGGVTHALYLLPINLYVNDDATNFGIVQASNLTVGLDLDNPYWSLKNVIYSESTSHFMGSLKFNYDLNGNKKKEETAFRFDMTQRIGVDYSGTTLKQSVKRVDSYIYPDGRVGGIFSDNLRFMHDLIFNAVKRFENRSSIKISAGVLFSGNNINSTNTMGTGILKDNNSGNITQVEKSITNDLIVEQYDAGLMFNVEYNYKKVISAALGIRQDFLFESAYAGSYALPYPVLDVGFVFTELSKQSGNKGFGGLTYGKMRASFGASGNAPTPYYYNYVSRALDINLASNAAVNNPNPSLYAPSINGSDHPFMDVKLANNLRPEYKLGADVGFDFGFLKDRVLLKMGYFFEMLNGGILSTYVDESTLLFSNAMNMTTQGAELSLYSKPVVSKNFEWNLDIHASFSRSMVSSVSVDDGNGNVSTGPHSISGIQNPNGNKVLGTDATTDGFTLYNAVAEGAAFGSFYGTYWDENREKQVGIIGDPNPWVRMGLQNKLSFYGVDISFLINFRIGGDVWNGTSQKMNYYGVGVETANREEIGNVPVEGDLIGVNWAETSKQYWQDVMGSVADGGIEKNIHSIKLKDVTIAYNYKNKKEMSLKGWQIYLKLRDMYTWSTLSNGLDPDTFLGGTGSHTYGVHYFNNPQSRAIIAGMKFTF